MKEYVLRKDFNGKTVYFNDIDTFHNLKVIYSEWVEKVVLNYKDRFLQSDYKCGKLFETKELADAYSLVLKDLFDEDWEVIEVEVS